MIVQKSLVSDYLTIMLKKLFLVKLHVQFYGKINRHFEMKKKSMVE